MSFDANHNGYQQEYWTLNDGLYKSEDVSSFVIAVRRTEWGDRAERRREGAEEAAERERQAELENKLTARRKAIAEKKTAAERLKLATERAKLALQCRVIYDETSNKKVSDLTVRESQAIHACEGLGMYPP